MRVFSQIIKSPIKTGWAMNLKTPKTTTKSEREKNERLRERKQGILPEKALTKEEIEEKVNEYVSKGWVRCDGAITLGFVSPCGEYFNCYDLDTGTRYSFGTDLAAEIHRYRKRWGKWCD